MKRKVVLYIGMDDDGAGSWTICSRKMCRHPAHGYFHTNDENEFSHVCDKGARLAFGAPPCKLGKQVKVTLRVEKIEKEED